MKLRNGLILFVFLALLPSLRLQQSAGMDEKVKASWSEVKTNTSAAAT